MFATVLLNYHIGHFCSVKMEDLALVYIYLCLVVCVWYDVLCHFIVVGRCIFIDIDRFRLCSLIIVFCCV